MTHFYGNVGYKDKDIEVRPGVFKPHIVVAPYYGMVNDRTTRWGNGDSITDTVELDLSIEIFADDYAFSHYQAIRYVEYMGERWRVKSIKPGRPRITLTLGGVYNGQSAEVTTTLSNNGS